MRPVGRVEHKADPSRKTQANDFVDTTPPTPSLIPSKIQHEPTNQMMLPESLSTPCLGTPPQGIVGGIQGVDVCNASTFGSIRCGQVSSDYYSCFSKKNANRATCYLPLPPLRLNPCSQVENLLNDEQDRTVPWLPGTGRSTIAQTIAGVNLADRNFCAGLSRFRDFEARDGLRSILLALAFQLSHQYQWSREEQLTVLTVSPDACRDTLFLHGQTYCLAISRLCILGPALSSPLPMGVKTKNLYPYFFLGSPFV